MVVTKEKGFSLLELVIVCAIIGVVAAFTLASLANRDEAGRLIDDAASRIRARRAAAVRLNALVEPTLLENYRQPAISIDFTNADTTAPLLTEGDSRTTFTAPATAGATGTWNFIYQGRPFSLPAGWRLARTASELTPIPVIVLGTPTSVISFKADGTLDTSSLPSAPSNTNPNQESPFPALYFTNGRAARAVAVHPSGLTEIWQYDETSGLWRGFGNRLPVVGP